jgi:hypothetical protein
MEGALAATAPFHVETGRPMVEVFVGDQGPYPFVFDTGALRLVVTQELVAELSLEVSGTTEVSSPMGGPPVEVSVARVPSIDLGGVSVTDLEAIVLDMNEAVLGAGVIGPAILRKHGPITIDFESNVMTLGDDARIADVETWLPFGESAPLLDVKIDIGGLVIHGHIDTGSPGILSLPVSFKDQLPITGPVQSVGRARTIDADFEILAAPIHAVAKVGDADIPLTEVSLAEIPVANLGTGGLRGLVLHIDWDEERFALTGTAKPPERRPRMRAMAAGEGPPFGILALPASHSVIEVLGTEPGSRAAIIGLLKGDRIVAINGQPLTELAFEQVRTELGAAELELTVERDGQTIVLSQGP